MSGQQEKENLWWNYRKGNYNVPYILWDWWAIDKIFKGWHNLLFLQLMGGPKSFWLLEMVKWKIENFIPF